MLGHIQRGIRGLLRHMIDVDDQAAPHHLLQQNHAIVVQAARIGVPAAHRGMRQRLGNITHRRHLLNERWPMHAGLGR